jgi:lysophospholipase D
MPLRIPLLEDVFKLFPSIPINLDIKYHSDDLIQKVNDLIIKYKRQDITVWGSFDQRTTDKCFKLNPNIDFYYSQKGVIRLLILLVTGLLPFCSIDETHFEIIMPNFIKNRSKMKWIPYLSMKILEM